MLLYKISQWFSKPYERFDEAISVKIDSPNYTKKAHLKKLQVLIHLITHQNQPLLKSELDIIDIDKLKTVSLDLNKLSNVVNNDVFKKLCMKK